MVKYLPNKHTLKRICIYHFAVFKSDAILGAQINWVYVKIGLHLVVLIGCQSFVSKLITAFILYQR